MEERQQRPTAEEVIAKLKDDGDFDTLRLQIIRKVKDNEELRNSIIKEVKESEILNQDGSENLKPRQLSDAIYQELGKKIMGQISDEVWKVIRNETTKEDIKSTVESVYNKIVNPTPKEEDIHSSPIENDVIKKNGASCDESEPKLPSSSAPSNHKKISSMPTEEELDRPVNVVDDYDDLPPGFDNLTDVNGGADLPPGFETRVDENVDMPPGFSTGAGDDDDDPDVPPGFG